MMINFYSVFKTAYFHFGRKSILSLLVFGFVSMSHLAFAQPANDDCSTAVALTIAANQAACTQTTGTTVGGTPSVAGYVCSGSWFNDDVWYSFTTGATVPADGYKIQITGGTTTTFGMALYKGCGTSEMPFHCFSNSDGTRLDAEIAGLTPNTTYYIRLWSGGSATGNAGTFSICMFNRSVPANGTVIWEDDFSNGLSNWTATGTPSMALWEWMPIATAGRGGFADSSVVISSLTSANGALIFDSNYYVDIGLPTPQVGTLTSPIIDCSTAGTVGIEFHQAFRQYQSATTLSYSIDGGNTFNDIPLNTAVAINTAIPTNDKQSLFLPFASGEDSVVIQFRFDADYYYWMLDDIKVISLPNIYDLEVTNAVYPPKSYATPISQLLNDTLDFSLTVNNKGSIGLSGIRAYAEIQDASLNTIYIDSVSLGSYTLPQSFDTIVEFPNRFMLNTLGLGQYTIRYSVQSDSTDFDPSDNFNIKPLEVSDSTFSMTSAVTNASRPGGGGDYMLGNLYETAPNFILGDYRANSVEFTCAKNAADGPLDGSNVTIYLIEVSANVNEDWTNFNANNSLFANTDLSVVGLGSFTFPTGTANYDNFKTDLQSFSTGQNGVDLKPETRYLTMVEYNGSNNIIFAGLGNEIANTKISSILYDNQWFTGGFAGSDAVVDLNIEYVSNVSVPATATFMTGAINADEGTNAGVTVSVNGFSSLIQTTVDVKLNNALTTASLGADFIFADTTFTIAPQSNFNGTINIPIIFDNIMDVGEVIVLDMIGSNGVIFGSDSTITITINDTQPQLIDVNDYSAMGQYNETTTINLNALLFSSFVPYGIESYSILSGTATGSVTIDTSTMTMTYTPQQNVCGNNDTILIEFCDIYNCDTAMIAYSIACPPFYNIGQIDGTNSAGVANFADVTCEISGTVYGIDFRGGSGYSFTLIDVTGGINVFSFDDMNGYTVTEGDLINVFGTTTQFNGLLEMVPDSIVLVGTGSINQPTIVTMLDEATESEFVKIETFTLVDTAQWTNGGSGFNVDVRNTTDTLTLRIDADCDLFGTAAPAGWFNVTGLGGQYDSSNPYTSGYQLFPRNQGDIELLTNTNEPKNLSGQIKLFPNPTSGFLNIVSEVNLTGIRITNILGQEVMNMNNVNTQISLDVSDFANGVYIITFMTEEGVWSEQFVKN
jgi:hypothetical protein